MAKTVVIHIGDPKTGTSSIQQTLIDHAYDSPDVSVDYQPYLNAFQLANSLYGNEDSPLRDPLFRQIAAWLNGSSTDVSVISAEMFFRVDPVVLQEALRTFLPDFAETARIIAYVRPHAPRFLSQFVQISKTGSYWGDMVTLYDRMVNKGTLMYTERFKAWRKVFGERFTLRPMIRDELRGRDVVADFFQTALNGSAFTLHPAAAFNESPSLEVLTGLREMYRVLNKRGVELSLRQSIGQFMVNKVNSAAAGQGTKLRLEKAIYDKLAAHCAADAAELDAEFFGRPIMSQALAEAARDCVDEALPLDVVGFYPPDTLAKLRRTSHRLAGLMLADGELWRSDFFRRIKQRPDSPELRKRVKNRAEGLRAIWGTLGRVTKVLTEEFQPFDGTKAVMPSAKE